MSNGKASGAQGTGTRCTTRDVERERSELLDQARQIMDPRMKHHIGLRRRCACRRYIDDTSAHPSGSDRNCKKERLQGQVWINSISEERDAYQLLLKMVKDEKKNNEIIDELETQISWFRGFEHASRTEWDTCLNNYHTLMDGMKQVIAGIQTFANGQKDESSALTLLAVSNNAVELVRSLRPVNKDLGTSGGNTTEDDDDDDDDRRRSDSSDDGCVIKKGDSDEEIIQGGWSHHDTGHTEGKDGENLDPNTNSDEQKDDDQTQATGGAEVDDDKSKREDPRDKGEGPSTHYPPHEKKTPSGVVLDDNPDVRPKKSPLGPVDDPIDPDLRARGYLPTHPSTADRKPNAQPQVVISGSNIPFLTWPSASPATAGRLQPPPPPPPPPQPSLPTTGPVIPTPVPKGDPTPPVGYEFPGLFDKTVPLCHQTTGHLAGGSPNTDAMKWLTKMVTVTISKSDSAESWIDKYAQLRLQLKCHASNQSLYTILALWVSLTPTLFRHYADLLDKKAHFTSFEHFIKEFTASNFPDLRNIAMTRLMTCKQRDGQSVREYRIDFLELVKMSQRQEADYVFEFISGLRLEKHKRAVESKDWGEEDVTIDRVTTYLNSYEDMCKVRTAMDKHKGVQVATTNRGRGRGMNASSVGRGTQRPAGVLKTRTRSKSATSNRTRSLSRGSGPSRGRSSSVGKSTSRPTVVAFARSTGRGSFSRGFGRGRGRPNSRGAGNRNGNRTFSFADRIKKNDNNRKALQLDGGRPDSCKACFANNHQWTDATFSGCLTSCIFCRKKMQSVRHSHLECNLRPQKAEDVRRGILNVYPHLNSR